VNCPSSFLNFLDNFLNSLNLFEIMRKNTKKDILRCLKNKDFKRIKQLLNSFLPQDIAEFIDELDETSSILLFRTLSKENIAETFSYLELEKQEKLLRAFNNKEAKFILSELTPDDRTLLFEELPGIITRKLFKLLSREDLNETRMLLGYPEETVGRMMTPDYVSIHKDNTVEQALKKIKIKGKDSETLNMIYIVDSEKRLLGYIKLRKLILAESETKISDLMDSMIVKLSAYDDREEAVKLMKKYDLVALPVVDSESIMVGIVTIDDILDVVEEETTEDIERISSIEPLKTSYKTVKLFTLYKKRIVWLVMLVFISLITSGIISYYEPILSSSIVLVFFIPLLMGSAGNTGSQSATLMIRAIAIGDVKLNEWFKIIFKEIIVGTSIGITLGILASIVGIMRGDYRIGLIVGLSMFFVILLSNLIGASLPFLLSMLKIDPAVASSPLITTIADICGLLVYFTIALMVLSPI
jgi:magnesium transporter